MNQILITDKIIVTKEMRKKKNFYKKNIILSIFLMCILCSYYVYAEYDRNRYEQKSQDILNDLNIIDTAIEEDTTTMDNRNFIASNSIMVEDDILKVILGSSLGTAEEVKLGNILKNVRRAVEGQDGFAGEEQMSNKYITEAGVEYSAESRVSSII